MSKWSEYVQTVIDQIDACIKNEEDEALTLSELSRRLGDSSGGSVRSEAYVRL